MSAVRQSVTGESAPNGTVPTFGTVGSILVRVSLLYLIIALAWAATGRGDGRFADTAAVVAAVSTVAALVLAVAAAQHDWMSRGSWGWTYIAVGAAAVAAPQIARAYVATGSGFVRWTPAITPWAITIGCASILVTALLRDAAYGDAELLAALTGLLTVALAAGTGIAIVLYAAGNGGGRWWLAGVSSALAVGLAAAFTFVDEPRFLSDLHVRRDRSLPMAVAVWTAAAALQVLGHWRGSSGTIAFGDLLVPLGAAAVASAAFGAMAFRVDVRAGAVAEPPALAVWLAAGAVVVAATIGLVADQQALDLGSVAAVAVALLVARQSFHLRAARSTVEQLAAETSDLERRANLDPTTGLPNRAALDSRLAEEFERAVRYEQPVSICIVDIDRFKDVNDAWGHPVGDVVLREVGKSLRRSARSIDFVARYGGEEFVVIAPGTWTVDANILGERLRRNAALRFAPSQDRTFDVTVSLGVAGYPEHAADIPALVNAADVALYRSKRDGRNRVTVAAPHLAD